MRGKLYGIGAQKDCIVRYYRTGFARSDLGGYRLCYQRLLLASGAHETLGLLELAIPLRGHPIPVLDRSGQPPGILEAPS